MGRAAFLLLAALASMAGLSTAHAETRAWLDRNAIAPGEAVTLNIETDQPGAAPDYTPLRDAFTLGPPYRSPATGNRTLFGIALTPRREGAVDIPALQVGAERTAPQKLSVSAAHASAPVPRGDVFLESRVDDPAPYVQQSLGLTVRLYYATPLLSGELAQDAPDGASLQRIGDDVQSSREIGGLTIRWQATPIADRRSGVTVVGSAAPYDYALYEMEVETLRDGRTTQAVKVRRAGWVATRVMSMDDI